MPGTALPLQDKAGSKQNPVLFFGCRVHTLAVPIAQDLNALYAGADAGAVAALLAKLAVEKSLHGKLEVGVSLNSPTRSC